MTRASTQTSQLALSGFWAALGFEALLVGMLQRQRALRVASFLALGLLLAGASAYQRARVPLVRERRDTRGAV